MPNIREKPIELYEKALNYDGTGREMRFAGGDVTPIIANCVTVQKWIPVAERLPEEWEDVLVCSGGAVEPGWLGCDGVFYSYDKYESDTIYGVTHWMPLPEAPKE